LRKVLKNQGLNRIIDANINRCKEGLRVCEEITRFVLENIKLTAQFKEIRHEIDSLSPKIASLKCRLRERKASSDVGGNIRSAAELRRKNFGDIFFANIQRAKESVRVLEEFSKIKDQRQALKFKKIRYRIYELEKATAKKIASLYRFR
jgi:hypothetical protein